VGLGAQAGVRSIDQSALQLGVEVRNPSNPSNPYHPNITYWVRLLGLLKLFDLILFDNMQVLSFLIFVGYDPGFFVRAFIAHMYLNACILPCPAGRRALRAVNHCPVLIRTRDHARAGNDPNNPNNLNKTLLVRLLYSTFFSTILYHRNCW
jgi:hypothetical protein